MLSPRICLRETPVKLSFATLLWVAACGGHRADATAIQVVPTCTTELRPAPLRRITRFEYGRAVADLTGVDPATSLSLAPDEESLGFDDIATAYNVSALHAERYLEMAEQVAAALIGDGARLTAFAAAIPAAAKRCA